MMKIGFVTAILANSSLEEVMQFAAQHGFQCIEVMCWPVGKAERRYAGVTHIDVSGFDAAKAAEIKALSAKYGVSISSLGYYPNPLVADPEERSRYIEHIKQVIAASRMLDVNVMTTFIGRDPSKSIEDSWDDYAAVWKPVVAFAEDQGVKIGIENSPRELALTTNESDDKLTAAVSAALAGTEPVLSLTDEKGSRYVVPSSKIAYVEIGSNESRRVGFGA